MSSGKVDELARPADLRLGERAALDPVDLDEPPRGPVQFQREHHEGAEAVLAQNERLGRVEIGVVEREGARCAALKNLCGLRKVGHEVALPLLKPCPVVRTLRDEDQDIADDAGDRARVRVELRDEVVGHRREHIAQAQVHLRSMAGVQARVNRLWTPVYERRSVCSMSTRREVWGYAVWGAMGIVIAVPELWAAIGGKTVEWPTISGTVGYLEYWHVWVSIIVVGILVWAAFDAMQYMASKPVAVTAQAYRTPGGRVSRRDPSGRTVNAIVYFAAAIAIIVGFSLWAYLDRPHDRYRLGEVMYGPSSSGCAWWPSCSRPASPCS